MDFIDAMLAIDTGKKITRKSWKNCYWEKYGSINYREKFCGEAVSAGSIFFKFEDIKKEEKNAIDWEIHNQKN